MAERLVSAAQREAQLLPPPLWGRVGVGGKPRANCLLPTPHPALRADLPRKGGGEYASDA
jgi:hypothetical protein